MAVDCGFLDIGEGRVYHRFLELLEGFGVVSLGFGLRC